MEPDEANDAHSGGAGADEVLDDNQRPPKRLRVEEGCVTSRHESFTNGEKLRGMEFFKSIGSPRYVCAPMVDQSELAFRMLTRRYGVGLAYTPMFHSRLFSENAKYRKQQFSTCPEDRPLFVQFCGDDPEILVKAGKHIESECDAIDLNCGCPQGIARKGHYGAFLLTEGDLLRNIVKRMDTELKVPITVKIRLLSEADGEGMPASVSPWSISDQRLQDTLNLASSLEAAGASVITLHGRTKEKKGQNTGGCDWDAIRAMKQRLHIPVFANGGIESLADAQRCLEHTGCDAVMSSEALLEVPSLFSGKQVLQDDLTEEYLQLAKIYDVERKCMKSHLFRFLYAGLQRHVDLRAKLGAARGFDEIAEAATSMRERRAQERLSGDFSWPDAGWYRRYRNPLGGKNKDNDTKASEKETTAGPEEKASEKEVLAEPVPDTDGA